MMELLLIFRLDGSNSSCEIEPHTCIIQDVYARFTLDSATEFLMGDCPHSIREPMLLPGGVQPKIAASTGRTSAFVKALAVGQEHISTRLHMGRAWPSIAVACSDDTDCEERQNTQVLEHVVNDQESK